MERLIEEHGLKGDYVPFNLEAYKMRIASLRGMGEEFVAKGEGKRLQYNNATEGAIGDALRAGLDDGVGGGVNYVAMPVQVLKRLEAHAKVDDMFYHSSYGKTVRYVNRMFKGSVLPFNPRWGAGNVADMTLRMMMDQSGGPVQWAANWATGRRKLNQLKKHNPQAYHEVMEQLGHGFQTEALTSIREDRMLSPTIKKKLEQQFKIQEHMVGWHSDPHLHGSMIQRSQAIAKGLGTWVGAFWRMAQEYNPYGFRIQRGIENAVRTSAFGKADRELVNSMTHKWEESILITPEVWKDTVQRLSNTSVQNALAERVNGVLGDYAKLSPMMRTAVMSYSPFALWLRASTTWVLTLPEKHPAQTAVITAVNNLTEEDRRKLGLSMLHPRSQGYQQALHGKEETQDSYMQGSISLGGNLYPTQTLTSFGTFYDPGISTASDFLLPQISSSAFMIGAGLDWKGDKLTFPDGRALDKPQYAAARTGIAVSNLLETFFPAARWWKMIQAEGNPDETATVWNPKPQRLRETYVSEFPNSPRYEQPPKNILQTLFSPVRSYPIKPDPDTEVKPEELGPAQYGKAAAIAGGQERQERRQNAAESSGIWDTDTGSNPYEPEPESSIWLTQPKNVKKKPTGSGGGIWR